MANKRKKDGDQHVVMDSMLKARSTNIKAFEEVEAIIKSKKTKTGVISIGHKTAGNLRG